MADKEIFRPTGLEPSWANDQAINDPGESWDTTDTKIEPGAGKRDDGWLPNEQPSAQHTNHLLHELGKWVQYFSNVHHQTWMSPTLIEEPSLNNRGGNTLTRDMGGLLGGAWFSAGVAGEIVVSSDGYDWSDIATGTAALFDWSASKDPRDAPILGGNFCSIFGGSTYASVVDYVNSVATARVLPGAAGANAGCWCGGYGLFNVGGNDGAGNPIIWDSNPSAMNWTTLGITKNQSTDVVDIAHNPAAPLSVALGNLAGTASDIWTSPDGTTWTIVPDVFPASAGAPRCIAYNRELSLWMAILGALGNIYTSSDGTVWSPLTTAGFSAAERALHGRGNLWIVPNNSEQMIHASTDGGLTWSAQMVDFDRQIGAPDDIMDLEYAEDIGTWGVCMTAGYPAPTTNPQFRRSISCGTVLTKTDGSGNIVLYAPTVT